MHKFLVLAQECFACTRILCMHKNFVHAQESCACKRILCMHKNLVRAQQLLVKSMFFAKTRFFTNGLHMEDREVIRPPKFESWRCTSFLFLWFPRKKRFSGPWTFHDFSDIFRDFWRKTTFSKNDPEVSGSARGASPTYPGPYLTRFDENRLKHNYYKNQYKSCSNYSDQLSKLLPG